MSEIRIIIFLPYKKKTNKIIGNKTKNSFCDVLVLFVVLPERERRRKKIQQRKRMKRHAHRNSLLCSD